MAGKFLGIFIYADDIFILCPSRPGLQVMVDECQMFAQENNLTFSTHPNPSKSKTKCIVFARTSEEDLAPIKLNNVDLPWVPSVKHLGVTLETDNSMKIDIAQKRGKFIGKICSLRQEFKFVSPQVMMKIIEMYTMSFYGSCLYNIFSKDCERIFATYNVAVRSIFSLPRETHRFFIEEISESTHPKVLMASRLVGFHEMMKNSERPVINLMAKITENDCRTFHGLNLNKIA